MTHLTLAFPLRLSGFLDINSRMNRGFRVQYSSALGPYEGGLHFVGGMSSDGCKVSHFFGFVLEHLVQLLQAMFLSPSIANTEMVLLNSSCRRRQYKGVQFPRDLRRSHSLGCRVPGRYTRCVRREASHRVQLHPARYPAFQETFCLHGRICAEPFISTKNLC